MTTTGDAKVQREAHDDLEAFLTRHRRRVAADVTRALAWPVGLFVLITLAVILDLAADMADGVPASHLVAEAIALVLAVAGVVGTTLKLRAALRDGQELLGELELVRLDLAYWRREIPAAEPRKPALAEAAPRP